MQKKDYKYMFLLAQAVISIIIFAVVTAIFKFGLPFKREITEWYKNIFSQDTNIDMVTKNESKFINTSIAFDENSKAANASVDLSKMFIDNNIFNSISMPVENGILTSNFGERKDPFTSAADFHKGVDIAVPMGSEVLCAASGRVTAVGYEANGYGNYVIIEHSSGFKTLYAHCKSVIVKIGDTVNQGQQIAFSGNSGRSTGPHLHFEVRLHDTLLNPLWILPNNDSV